MSGRVGFRWWRRTLRGRRSKPVSHRIRIRIWWLVDGLHPPTLLHPTSKAGGDPGSRLDCEGWGTRALWADWRREQRQEQRQRFGPEGKASGSFLSAANVERAGPESASNRD